MTDLQLLEIPVTRTDLIFMHRSADNALSELEAAIADGDVDDSIGNDLKETIDILEQYINDNRD